MVVGEKEATQPSRSLRTPCRRLLPGVQERRAGLLPQCLGLPAHRPHQVPGHARHDRPRALHRAQDGLVYASHTGLSRALSSSEECASPRGTRDSVLGQLRAASRRRAAARRSVRADGNNCGCNEHQSVASWGPPASPGAKVGGWAGPLTDGVHHYEQEIQAWPRPAPSALPDQLVTPCPMGYYYGLVYARTRRTPQRIHWHGASAS